MGRGSFGQKLWLLRIEGRALGTQKGPRYCYGRYTLLQILNKSSQSRKPYILLYKYLGPSWGFTVFRLRDLGSVYISGLRGSSGCFLSLAGVVVVGFWPWGLGPFKG